MQQLFGFCDEIWPNSHSAVCLLSCTITKGDQETEGILPQLEDIYIRIF